MTAYYNELDPYAAQWLRNLIAAGQIADGEVDERSIVDVRPDDLRGFDQCHFFAGIGVWSYALRKAGWADDRPVWTGSCPCQPFSTAGAKAGFNDERNLWPVWFQLIRECRPTAVYFEQVASKDGLSWLDFVHDDLEGEDYAVGSFDLSASSFGAPHIRQRIYGFAGLENADSKRLNRQQIRIQPRESRQAGPEITGRSGIGDPGPTNGFWRDADWLYCRDGKWRAVESGTFPLATGAANRLVCLCASCETETVIYENMPFLRRFGRGHEGREAKEILRQKLLQATQIADAIEKQKHGTLSSEGGSPEMDLHQVRIKDKTASASQGQESIKRQTEQSGSALHSLSHSRAFANSVVKMRGMWGFIQGGESPERQQDLLCIVCERMGSHICEKEVGPNRVGRLRAYGNGLCAETAKGFIESVMEAT